MQIKKKKRVLVALFLLKILKILPYLSGKSLDLVLIFLTNLAKLIPAREKFKIQIDQFKEAVPVF